MTDRQHPPTFLPNVMRYGREEALPARRLLRAGPIEAVLEGGDLRYVTLGGEMVVLRLYGAIRDQNWDTIEPRFTRYEVEEGPDGFSVRFTAECVANDVDFAWNGEIDGSADGVIRCVFDGEARRPFLRNRIGWCVLHPMTVAGLPAETETPDGRVAGEFPVSVMPWQPFMDMQSISHSTRNGGRVTIRFEGDLFEMEDQRNWTDASYKTYSTPLRLQYPVQLRAGDRVRQVVTIEGVPGANAAGAVTGDVVDVVIGSQAVSRMPVIGLGAASHGKPLQPVDLERLGMMGLGHVRGNLDVTGDGWRDRLAISAADAAAIGVPLEVELQVGPAGEGAVPFFRAVTDGGIPLARVLVFPAGELVTTEPALRTVIAARDAAGIGAPVGGGSRAFFTELNRASGTLPFAEMEIVGYPMNPTVHATDNASVVETLAAQPVTAASARALAGGKELAVGPVTFRMPFNPNATGPAPEPAPGALPATVDERQPSLFAAAWTAGSVGRLAREGVASLTYFQTNGWRGVMERSDHPLRVPGFHSWPGMVFPVWHVLADAMAMRGGDALPLSTGDPLRVDGLAAISEGRLRMIVSNLSSEPVTVRVALPASGPVRLRTLDETSFALAASDPDAFRNDWETAEAAGGAVELRLNPYATVTLEGKPA